MGVIATCYLVSHLILFAIRMRQNCYFIWCQKNVLGISLQPRRFCITHFLRIRKVQAHIECTASDDRRLCRALDFLIAFTPPRSIKQYNRQLAYFCATYMRTRCNTCDCSNRLLKYAAMSKAQGKGENGILPRGWCVMCANIHAD